MASSSENLSVAPDDEDYWQNVRAELEPMYVNTQLVNTRRGPAPMLVRQRVRSLVDLALSYELDEYEPLREMKESGSSVAIRNALAHYFHTTADHLALTRNAMEGVATVLYGVDLEKGDEILATKFCYDFNLAMLRQRASRQGIVVKLVDLPLGVKKEDDIVTAFERAIGPKTKLISLPHVVANLGLVLPINRICALAKQRGVFSFVDGAHSVGHISVDLEKLGCDAFAACLHKWMHGPRGTGFLYVKRERISEVWPLFATWSGCDVGSIEKLEEVGTVFKALPAAIPTAIAWNLQIGQKEKSARFRYLRHRWTSRLCLHPKVKFLTDLEAAPGTGFAAFVVDGMENQSFAKVLLERFGIHVLAFEMDEDPSVNGIHLSPGLANTVEEVDRFVEAALTVLDRS